MAQCHYPTLSLREDGYRVLWKWLMDVVAGIAWPVLPSFGSHVIHRKRWYRRCVFWVYPVKMATMMRGVRALQRCAKSAVLQTTISRIGTVGLMRLQSQLEKQERTFGGLSHCLIQVSMVNPWKGDRLWLTFISHSQARDWVGSWSERPNVSCGQNGKSYTLSMAGALYILCAFWSDFWEFN